MANIRSKLPKLKQQQPNAKKAREREGTSTQLKQAEFINRKLLIFSSLRM
jgi:hypothetical protein